MLQPGYLGRGGQADSNESGQNSVKVVKSAKTKRGRREGDGKKNVTTICDKRHDNLRQTSRQFATFYDNFRLFLHL